MISFIRQNISTILGTGEHKDSVAQVTRETKNGCNAITVSISERAHETRAEEKFIASLLLLASYVYIQ